MQVTEMQAEYFAPKEGIVLQNDKPSDMYLLVSGAVVRCVLLFRLVYVQRANHFEIWLKSLHDDDDPTHSYFIRRTFWRS